MQFQSFNIYVENKIWYDLIDKTSTTKNKCKLTNILNIDINYT